VGQGWNCKSRDYILSEKGNENHHMGTRFYAHHRIVSAVKGRVC
jgi:hypothetical protein